MTTKDLYELAALDVLGLLDDEERSEFERAFRSADPAVQADIRREQLRYSDLDSLLPVVETPAGLKTRVLNAVREAIGVVQLEPIARIGPGSARVTRWNTGPLWRAACIGFAAATLVLAGYVGWLNRLNAGMSLEISNAQGIGILSQTYGANFTSGMARFQVVAFSPAQSAAAPAAQDAGDKAPAAQLYFDPEKKKAYLFCDKLPADVQEYTLVIRGNGGADDRSIQGFVAKAGGIATVQIENIQPADFERLAIRTTIGPSGQSQALLVAKGV